MILDEQRALISIIREVSCFFVFEVSKQKLLEYLKHPPDYVTALPNKTQIASCAIHCNNEPTHFLVFSYE